ncbi:MAG: 3-dehydroquinate synthase [Chloroflexi bacterium]|nr:3-dehydroquinate synthase [Chloroflexota bacterium]
MKKVRVKLGARSYDIRIGPGLLKQAGQMLKEMGLGGKAIVITDPIIRRLYGDSLRQSLAESGFSVTVLEVPEGEEQKSLETAGLLYRELTGAHVERMTPILAMGGGVIGDLSGFVAATYLRGVPFVQIPTTLLAQVDSSIGGKVAVNHGLLKNKIGAFYQPRLVVADVALLKSLSAGEISDGLAEIIKYGVIADSALFIYLEHNVERIKALDEKALTSVIYRSAKIKARVVARDEQDLGLRNVLNYGHTVGHAIESVSDFAIRHGQAVAIGMVAAAKISNRLNILPEGDMLRIRELIIRAGLPTGLPAFELDKLVQAMKHDKKVLQGKVRFILPRTIGEVFITDGVDPEIVEQVLRERDEEA